MMRQENSAEAEARELRHLLQSHSGQIREALDHKIEVARRRGDTARASIYAARRSCLEQALAEALWQPDLVLLSRFGRVGRAIAAAAQQEISTGIAAEADLAAIGDELARMAEQFDD